MGTCSPKRTVNVTNLPEKRWEYSYDFDSDGKIDTINYSYSGGAHCCYKLSVYLSYYSRWVEIPYYVDGGYIGFDLSKPENFNVKLDNEGVPGFVLLVADVEQSTADDKYLGKKIRIDFIEEAKMSIKEDSLYTVSVDNDKIEEAEKKQ